ncbi:MAG: hypothetical protein LC799_14600 [Actinobacteria bacterium]|nr:hypothetical protein [Actinomycetota bacterium]
MDATGLEEVGWTGKGRVCAILDGGPSPRLRTMFGWTIRGTSDFVADTPTTGVRNVHGCYVTCDAMPPEAELRGLSNFGPEGDGMTPGVWVRSFDAAGNPNGTTHSPRDVAALIATARDTPESNSKEGPGTYQLAAAIAGLTEAPPVDPPKPPKPSPGRPWWWVYLPARLQRWAQAIYAMIAWNRRG